MGIDGRIALSAAWHEIGTIAKLSWTADVSGVAQIVRLDWRAGGLDPALIEEIYEHRTGDAGEPFLLSTVVTFEIGEQFEWYAGPRFPSVINNTSVYSLLRSDFQLIANTENGQRLESHIQRVTFRDSQYFGDELIQPPRSSFYGYSSSSPTVIEPESPEPVDGSIWFIAAEYPDLLNHLFGVGS